MPRSKADPKDPGIVETNTVGGDSENQKKQETSNSQEDPSISNPTSGDGRASRKKQETSNSQEDPSMSTNTAGGGSENQKKQETSNSQEDTSMSNATSVDGRASRKKQETSNSQEDPSMSNLRTNVNEERRRLLELKTVGNVNIAVFGPKGVGKSSLINGIIAAVTQKGYREITTTGLMENTNAVTQCLQGFTRCGTDRREDLRENEELLHEMKNLPRLIDIAGFPEENSPAYQELLKAVLFGRIKDGDSLREAIEDAGTDPDNRRAILDRFPVEEAGEEWKAHRLVFVASTVGGFPESLIQLVNNVATSRGECRMSQPDVPVFLVITKTDLKESTTEYEKKKKKLVEGLGLVGSEDLKCFEITNYTSANAPERFDRNYPEIDINILKFLRKVSDPMYQVIVPNNFFHQDPDGGWLLRSVKRAWETLQRHQRKILIFLLIALFAVCLLFTLFQMKPGEWLNVFITTMFVAVSGALAVRL